VLREDASLLEVRGEVSATFLPALPFDDPHVIAGANREWSDVEHTSAIARNTGDVYLSTEWEVPGLEHDAGHAPASLPVAYPIALLDLFHARGQSVIAWPWADELVLYVPVPRSLRPAPPQSAVPTAVLVIAGLLAVLACLAVAWYRIVHRSPPNRLMLAQR
jgi:hypothetical protein